MIRDSICGVAKQNPHPEKYLTKPRIFPVDLREGMSVEELVYAFEKSGAFNAGRLAEACRLYERMIDEDSTIALTLTGATIPAGLGGSIISLMKKGFIDFIISTGANFYHDLHFALDLPVHQGDFMVDDRKLLEHRVVRIYDIFITDELLNKTDAFIQHAVSTSGLNGSISTSELHHVIGKAVIREGKYPEYSIVAQAADLDVPLYTPSPGDSSIGINLAYLKLLGGNVGVDPDLDVLETASIVLASEKNGVVILGGGSPKNFYLQTQPTLSQILHINRGGHDYVIQITAEGPQWGGLTGATPSEAISWGKINPKDARNNVVVYSDATIAAPILFAYIMSTRRPRRLRRLYGERQRMVEQLKLAYLKSKKKGQL